MADEWKAPAMRHRMVQQIDELLRQTPEVSRRSAQELENSVFQKATNKKEEYQHYMNKLISVLKDQAQTQNINVNNASNLTAMLAGPQINNSSNSQMAPQGMTSGGQMTIGSSAGPMMHTNTQPQMVHPQQTVCTQHISQGNTSGGHMTHTGVSTNQGTVTNMAQNSFIPGTAQRPGGMPQPGMVGGIPNQSDIVWQGHQKVRRGQNDMIMINVNPKHPGMNAVQVNPQLNKGAMSMNITQNDQVSQLNVGGQIRPGVGLHPRVPSPGFPGPGANQLRSQSVTPTSIPAALQQQGSHSSVTFITPSPTSNATPSPLGGRMNQLGAPSPNGMLNTPGQPQNQIPSPASSGSIEERVYKEKVKQLQHKYLDTLREVVQKFGNNDSEKARKIKNFLEVLENPQKRSSTLENLRRIETLLERLLGSQTQHREPKNEDNPTKIFFDAINLAMESPKGSHTLHRTLSPALKTLLGPDLEPNLPKKRKIEPPETPPSEGHVINDIIQGEVARLPPRFKVNLDGFQISGSDDLTLVCQLDDVNLPCVPPIKLLIPPSYPNMPPQCKLSEVDYDTTDFLRKVREIMNNRQFHLPEVCTLTMILDTWEMSVRQACSGKPFIADSINPLINLNILK